MSGPLFGCFLWDLQEALLPQASVNQGEGLTNSRPTYPSLPIGAYNSRVGPEWPRTCMLEPSRNIMGSLSRWKIGSQAAT